MTGQALNNSGPTRAPIMILFAAFFSRTSITIAATSIASLATPAARPMAAFVAVPPSARTPASFPPKAAIPTPRPAS